MGKSTGNDDPLAKTGSRLQAIADRLHQGNKSALARAMGMKPASFAKYTNGQRRPGTVVLKKLSRMGVNVNWVLTGEGRMIEDASIHTSQLAKQGDSETGMDGQTESSDSVPDVRLHRVPLMRATNEPEEGLKLVETGAAEWLSEPFIREHYGVRPELLRDFLISGDAMAGTINPGDRLRAVLWDCQSPNDGVVCLVQGPVSLMIRRVRWSGERVQLVADHPDVAPDTISLEKWNESYTPIARALEVIQRL